MDSSSTFSYENDRDYDRFYDSNFDSSSVSQLTFDGMSEYSDEYYSIYEQSLTDSYSDELYDEELSSNFSFYDTDSSFYTDCQSERSSITTRSLSIDSTKQTLLPHQPKKLSGILKNRTSTPEDNRNINNINKNYNNASITQETIDKIRESELEDILQYAKDIIHPDPAANVTHSSQPAKVIPGTFKHLLSVKEINSKTGAFKYRSIEITRDTEEEDLGFNVRQGDGWEKKNGIYISRVALGSVFDQYEILRVGDEVIKINKVEVKQMNVDDVVRLLHIPEKLCVTIKMLTPFSQKRVEKSDINKLRFQQKKFIASKSIDDVYKLAHLKINTTTKKRIEHLPKRTILMKRGPGGNIINKESKTVKISPYRSMEDGKTPFQKNNLSPIRESPIRESMSELQLNKTQQPNMNRRQSYVTWSDQRSVKSD